MNWSNSATKNLLLAFGVGALVGWLIFSAVSPNQPSRLRPAVKNAFFLGVTIKFPNATDKDAFKVIFTPLAKYVEEKEFGTISYILMESDKDPLQIMILERYQDKDYYLSIHRSSGEFKAFREKFQEMIARGASVDGSSYIETDVGFVN
ncbi:antibiotic biosynthesis monooxygenase [archaeon]|nr:MAG: antibiotic biosynthesis monooxygenase [archaeon]